MLADGRYWDYGYNDRGEVISGIQQLDGDVPIKGYGFGYAFDAIGNRTISAADGASGQRQTTYVANQVNQYSSITSPGFEYLIGSAAANATVTGNWTPEGNPPPALQPSDIVQAIRQGNRWYLELGADNGPGPVWRTAMVCGIVREGADGGAKDALQELQRSLFIPAATQSLGYDADGNLTCDGRWNYSWDGNNRLLSVESVAATPDARKRKVEYSYDYMGRMVQRIEGSEFNGTSYATSITTRIVYDGWNPILEFDASGTVLKRYYWGLDLSGSLSGAGGVGGLLWMEDVGASKAYGYCYDGNGNVLGLVDLADGSLAANYEYGPFGELITATGPAAAANPFRFSTKRTDPANGLVYYGYRHYHPRLGRWMSRDPIRERFSLNRYSLLSNSAINHADLLGLVDWSWINEGASQGDFGREDEVYAGLRSQNINGALIACMTASLSWTSCPGTSAGKGSTSVGPLYTLLGPGSVFPFVSGPSSPILVPINLAVLGADNKRIRNAPTQAIGRSWGCTSGQIDASIKYQEGHFSTSGFQAARPISEQEARSNATLGWYSNEIRHNPWRLTQPSGFSPSKTIAVRLKWECDFEITFFGSKPFIDGGPNRRHDHEEAPTLPIPAEPWP